MSAESVAGARVVSALAACARRPGRGSNAKTWTSAVAVTGAMLTACTVQPNQPPASPPAAQSTPASTGPSSPAPASSVMASPSSSAPVAEPATVHGTVVVGGGTPARLALSVSKALFTRSSAVVVARADDQLGIADAAEQAERIGVPLLLLEPASRPAAPAAAGAVPSAPDVFRDLFTAEIDRLGCRDVLAVGNVSDALASALPGVRIVEQASDLASASAPASPTGLTVLVHAGGNAATAAAARAATVTAHAAGARVVAIRGSDPRADPAAIAALSGHPAANVLAAGTDFGPAAKLAARVAVARTGAQLPGGGETIFPGRRFVALYGQPSGPALGALGAQNLDATIARVKQLAASYVPMSKVPVVPTFEIIATVAQASAGADGDYSAESSVAALLPWVQKAKAAGVYVVLDLQPGSADLLKQAQLYTPLLVQPNVGLAIDPEWALGAGQKPLEQIGSVNTSQINAVGAWLAALTASKHLPQKLFVLHQFRLSMIGDEPKLKSDYDEVAVLIHMDGQGTPANKKATWTAVTRTAPKGVPFGWKNFYREDHPMVSAQETMAQRPAPMMISYQ